MYFLSNSLSLIRAPAALLFLHTSVSWRLFALCIAILSDSIDGWIARRYGVTTAFGSVIDPLMDKFFVYFALMILFLESKVPLWSLFAMTSRDGFVVLHGAYLKYSKKWHNHQFRSAIFGKITTAAQFCVLVGLTLGRSFPSSLYWVFVVFGLGAFLELFFRSQHNPVSE